MASEPEIRFWEQKIEHDSDGKILRHPLKSHYTATDRHGMAFEGHNLAASENLQDIRCFYLEFHGDPVSEHEEWATPLRAQVLERLQYKDWHWYLSFIGKIPEQQGADTYIYLAEDFLKKFVIPEDLGFTLVRQEERQKVLYQRLFVETPKHLLKPIITRYWPYMWDYFPAQGFLLPPDSFHLLHRWNVMRPDEHLFREVMDNTFVAFCSFPTTHRYFVFLTNKLTCDELAELLQLDDLKRQAQEIYTNK
jgi:hypothetical protein